MHECVLGQERFLFPVPPRGDAHLRCLCDPQPQMVAYEKFHDGQMSDYIPTDADLQKGFDGIPRFPGNEI